MECSERTWSKISPVDLPAGHSLGHQHHQAWCDMTRGAAAENLRKPLIVAVSEGKSFPSHFVLPFTELICSYSHRTCPGTHVWRPTEFIQFPLRLPKRKRYGRQAMQTEKGTLPKMGFWDKHCNSYLYLVVASSEMLESNFLGLPFGTICQF